MHKHADKTDKPFGPEVDHLNDMQPWTTGQCFMFAGGCVIAAAFVIGLMLAMGWA